MGIPYYEEMEDKKHDRTHIYNRYTQRSTPDPADHLCPAADHHHRLHTTRHPGNHTHPKKNEPPPSSKKILRHLTVHIPPEHSRFLYRTLQTSTSNEQKSARGRWSACMAGICNDVRKSWHSEAPENGSGEVLPALSLRSAELGKHKAFLANRSGARPEGLWNA